MRLTARGMMAAAAAMAAIAMTVSACVVVEAPPVRPVPRVRPEPPVRPQMCPQVYTPGCGQRDGRLRTFGNECQARASGYLVVDMFACGNPNRPAPDSDMLSDRECPQIYAPVCAVRGGQTSTYPNDCVAGGKGAKVIHTGPC